MALLNSIQDDRLRVLINAPRAASYTRVSRIKVNRYARTATRLNCGNAGFNLDEARDLVLRSVRFWDRLVSNSERRVGNRQEGICLSSFTLASLLDKRSKPKIRLTESQG